ncbi:HEPACAM family member 2 isoform X2 [Neoarius graeffei]|uniref:HEPACAM family member 2 isoform X2 n=1 Tax=Neoarius graeffei TaxID=443677 RepID=UPI00298C4E8C|nr:HEPACAM family member 2 isoform X2 [Neoarius graeffei]
MLSPVPPSSHKSYRSLEHKQQADMGSVAAVMNLLLCAMPIISGANRELISVPSVVHGIKGKPLSIAVETKFDEEGVQFQGTWFQLSPKSNHLVTFDKNRAIHNMLLKETVVRITPPIVSLNFTSLEDADEGDYQLTINIIHTRHNKSETVTKNVRITVNVPLSIPVVEKSSKGPLVEDQDNITLTCTVEKGTKPKFEWFRNNNPVNPSKRHMFLHNNSTLSISPVKKEDIGMYSCVVKNPISNFRSKVMDLSIYYGPYNLEVYCEQGLRTGKVFTVHQGEMVFFDCLADSNPPNTCVWISRRDNGTEVLMTGPRFEVASLKLGHATEFLCRAFNNVTNKQDETHFTLLVANLGKVFMKIYSRPVPEEKGLHRSGHEDATEDFGIYEFVSVPGKMESREASCRSLTRLDSARDLHTTIYDVIKHVPETPTLSLLK